MDRQKVEWKRRRRRHRHVRRTVFGTPDRPRLVVYRSEKHTYCQIVDDTEGRTLAAASTLTPSVREQTAEAKPTSAAALVGARIAELAAERGITRVAFDRGARRYHGRVKALAEAARKGGLKF